MLGGVDAQVDDLGTDAQTVEVGAIGALVAEAETALLVELHRVEGADAFEGVALEIEHLVFGSGDGTVDAELGMVFAGSQHEQG